MNFAGNSDYAKTGRYFLTKMPGNILIMRLLLTIVGLLVSLLGLSQQGSITGQVRDAQTQRVLRRVTVNLMPGNHQAFTDSLGNFRITGVPVQTYTLGASFVGYEDFELNNVIITSGNEQVITIEMNPAVTELEDVVVKARRQNVLAASLETPLSVQKLTAEEIKSNPGGNFDISRVVQVLPGVGGGSQGLGFRNDIIIRGGAPNENVYYLDGIEIPVLNHFQTQGSAGGPQGMLNVAFIEDVKLSTSAFDARYDNVLSGVFQFRQKNGNPNRFQGNARLSASEFALTTEGPLSNDGRTTFLASARRSYLRFLFQAIDLPLRPDYWDFQTKITHRINDKNTISFVGIGAIDEFGLGTTRNMTPEKAYILNAFPFIHQWNYTLGLSWRRLVKNGYMTAALSRNMFDNQIEQFEDNKLRLPNQQTLDFASQESENKLRVDWNKSNNGWEWSYGALLQRVRYTNETFRVIRRELLDDDNVLIQPGVTYNFESPMDPFWRYGAFMQAGKRFFGNRLGINAGIRTDMNSFTETGSDPLKTISPRASLSWKMAPRWSLNATWGVYYKLPPYTILGFADNNGNLVNKNADYLRSRHLTGGFEFLVNNGLRFTLEGFYKKYGQVPVSASSGISLSNLGGDFNVLGNEAVNTTGEGRATGVEFFAQKKLSKNFYGVFSVTFYKSEYSGADGRFLPSSWDNGQILSMVFGYKFPRNWELGLKFRYQGGAPYTPFDERLSRLNYLTIGTGVYDYSQLNSGRLPSFHAGDIRIDKKWNFNKWSLDVFVDVTNFYRSNQPAPDYYSFRRNDANTEFITSDGQPLKVDGSNAIPIRIKNDDAIVTPTFGFIVEW